MTPVARDVLTVIWQGEEVPGLTFYALRAPDHDSEPAFPSDEWPGGTEHRTSRLSGDTWEVVVWDVRITDWPSPAEFPHLVRHTLEALLQDGGSVSWVAREGYFVDPPDLFLPDHMSGGVLAALSPETGFRMDAALDEALRTLPDTDLLALRKAAGRLASAG